MMKLVVNAFLTLDGVMQAPGAPDEDRSGGFAHGGWMGPHADEDLGRIVTAWTERAGAFSVDENTSTKSLFEGEFRASRLHP